MSVGSVPGPRPPKDAQDQAGGGYQFAALAANTKIKLPLKWKDQYCRIIWNPVATGAALDFLFVPEEDPLLDVDNTDSVLDTAEPDYTVIDRAPDWITEGSVDAKVPNFGEGISTVLVLDPASAGRVKVRMAESWDAAVG